MLVPAQHPLELMRLADLHATGRLDGPLAPRFERLTMLACDALRVPIAAISLVDSDRQWFCSIQGIDEIQTARSVSFCGHAILGDGIFEIPDATSDERFADNPLVTGDIGVRFYAGRPLVGVSGLPLGAMCVIDRQPRTLDERERAILDGLGFLAEIELHRASVLGSDREVIDHLLELRGREACDAQTRLPNRQAVLHVLTSVLREPAMLGQRVGVVVLNIDGLAQLNESFGRDVADETIRLAAKHALASCRDGEIIGRLHGGEFLAVLAPVPDSGAAELAGERIRRAFSRVSINADDGMIRVSASAGLAMGRVGSGDTASSLLLAADGALRVAREKGRDRLEIAPFNARAA